MISERYKNKLFSSFPVRWVEGLRIKFIDFEKHPPLLIYQPGKVGSSSIYHSLKKSDVPYSVFHVHCLSEQGLSKAEANLVRQRQPLYHHLVVSRLLAQKIAHDKPAKCYVITIVRDPVAQILSGMFQNLHRILPEALSIGKEINQSMVEQYVNQRFSAAEKVSSEMDRWLDEEMGAFTGIDIFKSPFDYRKGFGLYDNGRFRVVLLRLESLSQTFDIAMKDLFEIPELKIKLCRANEGGKKWYAGAYAKARDEIVLSEEILSTIYASRLMQHVYADKIEDFIVRWGKRKK